MTENNKKNKNTIKKVFSSIGKIINIILIVILIILLIFNIYNLISRSFFDNDMPKFFGFASAVVVTGSMSGAIEIGDYIIIKEAKQYKEDDVITFKQNNMLITHRIIEVTEEGYITKGDANTAPDDMIEYEQIEGKVVLIIPKVGKVVDFIKTPFGILVILALVLLIFGVRHAIETAGKNKKENGNEKTD